MHLIAAVYLAEVCAAGGASPSRRRFYGGCWPTNAWTVIMSGQRLVVVGCTLLLLLAAGPTATARRKGKKPARAAQPLAPPGSDDPALLMKEADQAFARQDFAAAQKILEQALALAPADAMGQFKLGALLSKGRCCGGPGTNPLACAATAVVGSAS